MTKVKMLKTVYGSHDGINTQAFEAGKEYEVNDELLKNFIDDGVCELAKDKPKPEENKAVTPPENKKTKGKKAK